MKLESEQRFLKVPQQSFYSTSNCPYIALGKNNIFGGNEAVHQLIDFALHSDQPINALRLETLHSLHICNCSLNSL